MVKLVVVTLDVEGIHAWPQCPFEEVKFLRDPHRHLFKIRCAKKVGHLDRDIEIIMLKRMILGYLNTKYSGQFGSMSCEMIADDLMTEFNLDSCVVLEDGENGAMISK